MTTTPTLSTDTTADIMAALLHATADTNGGDAFVAADLLLAYMCAHSTANPDAVFVIDRLLASVEGLLLVLAPQDAARQYRALFPCAVTLSEGFRELVRSGVVCGVPNTRGLCKLAV